MRFGAGWLNDSAVQEVESGVKYLLRTEVMFTRKGGPFDGESLSYRSSAKYWKCAYLYQEADRLEAEGDVPGFVGMREGETREIVAVGGIHDSPCCRSVPSRAVAADGGAAFVAGHVGEYAESVL